MEDIEKEIVASGATAPRVTQADITANIADTEFVTHVTKSGKVLRWAVITTRSGFAVVGRPSVSVSPENDREHIGQQVAYENSREEMWSLMGYALSERLAAHAAEPEPELPVAEIRHPSGSKMTVKAPEFETIGLIGKADIIVATLAAATSCDVDAARLTEIIEDGGKEFEAMSPGQAAQMIREILYLRARASDLRAHARGLADSDGGEA